MRWKKAKPVFHRSRFGPKAIRLPWMKICWPTVWMGRWRVGQLGSFEVEFNPFIEKEVNNANGHMALEPNITERAFHLACSLG